MSVIQTIRDKASWLIIILVVLSLLGFILMDSSISRWTFSGEDAFTVGKVDGQAISYTEYQTALESAQKRYAQQAGGELDDQDKMSISGQVWQSLVETKIAEQAYANLGIGIFKNELKAILNGEVSLDILMGIPAFLDPNTRQVDPQRIKQYLRSLQENAKQNPEAAQNLDDFIQEVRKSALRQKYMAGLVGSEVEPKWLKALYAKQANQKASALVMEVPFYQLGVDKMEVSSEDLAPYIAKYEILATPQEARQIEYVVFDASPTAQDSLDIFNSLEKVKSEFVTAKDPNDVIAKTDATLSYRKNLYIFNKDIQQVFPQYAEKIMALNPGGYLGPFVDGMMVKSGKKNYALVRMIAKRKVPQQIRVRHVLVAINEQKTDVQAKQLIDSVALYAKSGVNFADLVNRYSDDQGSKTQGGEYSFEYQRDFVSLDSAFGYTAFYEPVNTRKVIKSSYGYHYVEVLSQQDIQDGYSVAILMSPIVPSVSTETENYNLANQLSLSAQGKPLAQVAKAKSYEVFTSPSITANQQVTLPKINYSRELVKWAFKEKNEGAVSTPMQVDNFYVVGYLKKIISEEDNMREVAMSKFDVVAKYSKIEDKVRTDISGLNSFADVATHYKVSAMPVKANESDFVATGDSSTTRFNSARLVGTMFNVNRGKEKQAWKTPIIGTSSVYFVDGASVSKDMGEAVGMDMSFFRQLRQRSVVDRTAISSMMEVSKIKDFRYKF